jgi:hypothetical protein
MGETSSMRVSAAPARAGGPALRAARVLLALLGIATVGGATYFTFVAAPEQGGVSGPIDVALGVWALAMGAGFIAAAVRLGARPSARSLRLTAALVGVHVAYSLIKLVGYDETEVIAFFAVDALILALLAAAGRAGTTAPTRPERSSRSAHR